MHRSSKASIRFLKKLSSRQKEIRRRILEITFESTLSHLGSAFSAVDVIDAIYQLKKEKEQFVLSAGHSATALYAVLEKNKRIDPSVIKNLHIHPDRNPALGIDVSTGSLGQGLPIALGMALANRGKRVFCVVTDGECAEGSIWEAFRVIHDNKVNNLIITVIANEWGAYNPISSNQLLKRIKGFGLRTITVDGHDSKKLIEIMKKKNSHPTVIFAKTTPEQFPFLEAQSAHYYVMNKDDFHLALEMLK
jgi:transketolase